MSTPNFRFKQFTVWHDKCAMKVGTDGVLLGATIQAQPLSRLQAGTLSPKGARDFRVLDIGTGTGLVALMIAQKTSLSRPLSPKGEREDYQIDAIDIVPEAVEQARENFARSPWSEHLHAYQSSLQEWSPFSAPSGHPFPVHFVRGKGYYNLIVSNPPYFVDSLKNPDKGRETARHTDTLSYEELIRHSRRLLAEDGILHLILPIEAEQEIVRLAREHGLAPTRLLYIHTTAKKAPKRLIIDFTTAAHAPQEPCIEHLTLMGPNGEPRSQEYQELMKDFYL